MLDALIRSSGQTAASLQARSPRLRGLDDALDIEIALRGATGAEDDVLATTHVPGIPIGIADRKHGDDLQRVARTRDPDRDIAAVRDDQAMEHYPPSFNRPDPTF